MPNDNELEPLLEITITVHRDDQLFHAIVSLGSTRISQVDATTLREALDTVGRHLAGAVT